MAALGKAAPAHVEKEIRSRLRRSKLVLTPQQEVQVQYQEGETMLSKVIIRSKSRQEIITTTTTNKKITPRVQKQITITIAQADLQPDLQPKE